MKKLQILVILSFFVFAAFKSDKPAYLLFTKEGKTVKYSKMLDKIKDADIVLFGESHNNPISHWLELELTKDLYELKKDKLELAAEMFETDNQLIINEYFDNLISQSYFEDEVRLWPNYQTDYKPLVEFAKKNGIPFVASNIPRRYASLVNKKGFEGLGELSDEAKTYLPPLPVAYDANLECYKSLLKMGGMGAHMSPNFPKAQAIKDATMAYFMLKHWNPGKQILHFNGSYHSDNFESIYWYLKKENPDLKIVTITTVSQKDVKKLVKENTGHADFTVCVAEDMTKTQ
ncbi:MAG TPA: ChaN family lipoprotein [Draconibacterium sp.]|nr:ChaN family lipoprotein [Draconibacterium sp.]